MRYTLLPAAIVIAILVAVNVLGPSPTSIVGVWEVVERSYERGDTSWTEPNPQPSLYVFTESYYGVQEIRESGARSLFDEHTSEDQRLAAFDVFHAHTGRYELEGDSLTITPSVAKSPNTMDGRRHTYAIAVDGNRLEITRISDSEGETRVTVLRRLE